jgi:hypothetical protein
MVLAYPGPLLTPPPSSFPPEDPFQVLLSHISTPPWEPDPVQGKQLRGQPQVAVPRPHTHADNALRQLTMHISTNDLH